jgi:hypothetical protein
MRIRALRIFRFIWVILGFSALAGAAQAASIFIDDCAAQGCQGTTLSLSVNDNGNGTFDVALTINADGYTGTRLGLNQVGFGAIQNWTSVLLDSAPNGSWLNPPVAANVSSSGLCATGSSSDKICTSGFVDITGGGDFTWDFTVTGGTVKPLSDWHIGGQFADSAAATRGQIISASPVPEPSAVFVFGVGMLLVTRRRS